MTTHVTKAFTNKTLHVDGEIYVDCEFKNCTLIYSGGALPKMSGSNYADCRWLFGEAAERTLKYVKLLRKGNHPALNDALDKLVGAAARKRTPAMKISDRGSRPS